MSVSGKDPALEVAPDRMVSGVRVVTEHDGRPMVRGFSRMLGQHGSGIEARAPQIVQPDELHAGDGCRLVAQHDHTGMLRYLTNLVRHIQHAPAAAVVMVAKNAHGAEPPAGRVSKDAPQLL